MRVLVVLILYISPHVHKKASKDTEAAVGDVQIPEVDPEVIGWHVGLIVGVDGDGVDVISVSVGKHSPRGHLHHQIHGFQHGNLEKTRGAPSHLSCSLQEKISCFLMTFFQHIYIFLKLKCIILTCLRTEQLSQAICWGKSRFVKTLFPVARLWYSPAQLEIKDFAAPTHSLTLMCTLSQWPIFLHASAAVFTDPDSLANFERKAGRREGGKEGEEVENL